MTTWKELRGADGSYQAVPVRDPSHIPRELARAPDVGFRTRRHHAALPQPTAPVADISVPKPFFTPWLSFTVGVFVGASLVSAALFFGLQHLAALPH